MAQLAGKSSPRPCHRQLTLKTARWRRRKQHHVKTHAACFPQGKLQDAFAWHLLPLREDACMASTAELQGKIKVCMFDQYGTVVDMQTGLTEVATPFLKRKDGG